MTEDQQNELDSDINLHGDNLEIVTTFKYIRSTLSNNGDLDAKMTHAILSGWNNWKRESGVLCDRRLCLRVKRKVFKTIVRPAMVYAAETWAVKKSQYVAEMRVLKMGEWNLIKL